MANYLIPASNAYNPYDHTVVVNYIPVRELKSGLIPHAYNEADNKQRNYSAGFFWEVRENHQIEFTATRSESETLATLLRPDFRRSFDDPSADRFYAAVDSSDPDVALNLFGNGTAQSPGFAEIFTHPLGRTRGSTVVRAFEPVARGELFQLWGGPITYAVGAVFRDEVYAEYNEEYRNKEFVGMSSKTANYGVEQPKEENTAYFGEFALPLVDRNNARPGLHSLVLSLQARRDTHSAVGGIGGLSSGREPFVSRFYVPGEGWRAVDAARRITVGTPELIDDKKTRTSKRLGLLYKPTENLALRASWSGSYKPPGYGVRFNPFGDYRLSVVVANDPYHPDAISSRQFYPLWNVGYQSHLRPEIGDTYSVSLNWTPDAIRGFLWQVAWSRVDFTDRIIGGHIVRRRFPRIGYAMPELVNRDDAGYITRVNRAYVNLSRDVSETLDARIEYSFATRLGRFTPALRYNRVLQEYLQVTPEADRLSDLGKGWGSDRYRIQGSLNWRWGRFEADVFASYVPSYESRIGSARCLRYVGRCVRPNQPLPPTIAKSLTTVDLTVSYQFDMGLRLRAGGRNIFYAKPHVIWYGYPYDATRWDARGRVLFMEVNWEM